MHPAAAPQQVHGLPPLPNATPGNGPALAAPIPAIHGTALAARLHVAVQQDPALAAAAALIELLACHTPVPDSVDDATCQHAAQLLLRLDEASLICRLARARPLCYELEVGESESLAHALAHIGATWPPSTRVLLCLSTALPADAFRSLHAFLMQPEVLDVQITGAKHQTTANTVAMAQALLLRPLTGLSLAGHRLAPAVLRALAGVEARALHLEATGVDAQEEDMFESALLAFVQRSGAAMLHMAHPSIQGRLAAQLLRCKPHWEVVHVALNMGVYKALRLGKHTVHKLDLHTQQRMLSSNAGFLAMLQAGGVNTLVVHGGMDLGKLSADLAAPAQAQGRTVERIEAFFVVEDGADLEAILTTIAHTHRVDALHHRPMPLALAGHTPLSEDAAARLAAIGLTRRMGAPVHETGLSAEWQSAVQAIADLLAPGRSVSHVIDFMRAPGNRLIPAKDLCGIVLRQSLNSAALRDKVGAFLLTDIPDALLREALARCLRHQPGAGREMCQALIHFRFPVDMPRQDWRAAARPFAQTLSRHTLGEGLDPDLLGKVSPSLATARPPPNTVATPTTAGTLAALGADEITALVLPSSAQAVERLLQRLRARKAALRFQPAHAATREALTAVLRLLTGRAVAVDKMSVAVLTGWASELLREGQWRLLRHALPSHHTWLIDVTTAHAADMLEKMGTWPAPQSTCHLTVSSALPVDAAKKVADFVASVAPDQLHLRLWLVPHADAEVWPHLTRMVSDHPGLELSLNGVPEARFPSAEVIALLEGVGPGAVHRLNLIRLPEHDAPVVQALTAALRRVDIRHLSVNHCGATAMAQILPCHTWDTLELTVSSLVEQQFENHPQAVTAHTLQLVVPHDRTEADQGTPWQTIVAACGALDTLDIWGIPVDMLALAQVLDGKRSVHTVRCVPGMVSRQQAKTTLALMRRNTSILRFEFAELKPPFNANGMTALDADILNALFDLTTHNRLREPQRFAWGAGKGFGWSLGGHGVFVDVGATMGGMLDPRSALALALTSKAAYNGAAQPRLDRINALTAALAPAITYRQLLQQLGQLIATDLLYGTPPTVPVYPEQPHNLVLNKVAAMRDAGLPDAVVGEVLWRRLLQLVPATGTLPACSNAELATVPHLLEAMAQVGAMPSLQWLRIGLGIDAQV